MLFSSSSPDILLFSTYNHAWLSFAFFIVTLDAMGAGLIYPVLPELLSHIFEIDRDATLVTVAGGALFSSDQGYALLKTVRGDSEQVELAVSMYPAVTDKHNFGHVLEAMMFGSSKTKVMKKLGF